MLFRERWGREDFVPYFLPSELAASEMLFCCLLRVRQLTFSNVDSFFSSFIFTNYFLISFQIKTSVIWATPNISFIIPLWVIILAILLGLLVLAMLTLALWKVCYILERMLTEQNWELQKGGERIWPSHPKSHRYMRRICLCC